MGVGWVNRKEKEDGNKIQGKPKGKQERDERRWLDQGPARREQRTNSDKLNRIHLSFSMSSMCSLLTLRVSLSVFFFPGVQKPRTSNLDARPHKGGGYGDLLLLKNHLMLIWRSKKQIQKKREEATCRLACLTYM